MTNGVGLRFTRIERKRRLISKNLLLDSGTIKGAPAAWRSKAVLRMTLGSRFVSPNLEQYVGINAMAQTMEVVVILSLS